MAQFTNQATLSYNGLTANSNIVTGTITQVLELWKTATPQTYRPGDILTYVVTIRNSGASAFTGLTVTDTLGAYAFGSGTVTPLTFTGDPVLYDSNGVPQPAPAVTAGPPLVISGLSVPAGGSVTLVYRARVNSYAPLGAAAALTNTATLTGSGLTAPLTAQETVTMAQGPALTILKALNPTTVVENGQVTYTFTLENAGSEAADAAAGIVLSDTFTPPLSDLSVTLNGSAWPAAGNYTYNAATGAFSTVAGRITVPAAAYTQNAATGLWTLTPGVTTVTVTGTI